MIVDSLPCLILEGFYWHGCNNIRNGVNRWRVGGGKRYPVGKKTPRGTSSSSPCQTSDHTSQKQHAAEDKANVWEALWIHAVSLKPPRGPTSSVLAFQHFIQSWKKPCEKANLTISGYSYYCVLIVWSNKMHFTCCDEMVSFPKSSHICKWGNYPNQYNLDKQLTMYVWIQFYTHNYSYVHSCLYYVCRVTKYNDSTVSTYVYTYSHTFNWYYSRAGCSAIFICSNTCVNSCIIRHYFKNFADAEYKI